LLVATLDIPGHPRQVRAARTFTALVLEAHDQPDDGTAGLLVSELVTNSLMHSASGRPGGMITVAVAITRRETIVEVTDDGGPIEPTISEDDEHTDAENGRGLRLVRKLSADWGYYRQGGRLTTWFDLGAKGPGAMSDLDCACGYQADTAVDLADHLGEAYITDDDIAPDNQAHAETGDGRTPGWRCLCGFSGDTAAGLDDHLLRVFTPDGGIGRDGGKHSVTGVSDKSLG
jgi:anti-sigma regulatory factor (Ser/Thr protein kinase)